MDAWLRSLPPPSSDELTAAHLSLLERLPPAAHDTLLAIVLASSSGTGAAGGALPFGGRLGPGAVPVWAIPSLNGSTRRQIISALDAWAVAGAV